jgi:hydroxyethylthiazole kinase
MGGFAAVAPPMEAAATALALFAEAGVQAEKQATGPGSFQPHFLDALHNTTPETLEKAGRITWQ